MRGDVENRVDEMLKRVPTVINLGVQDFAESLHTQGAPTIHVEWSPPAGGDRELMDLLDKLV